MKKFRNMLFKLSREGMGSKPEHDFVEITPVDNAVLHLAFLYDGEGGKDIRVLVTDTGFLGQDMKPHALHKRSDIEGGHTEQVVEYRLKKGGHYTL